MLRFIVTKNDDSVNNVLLIPIKGTNKFHFVNITKGHICKCEFDTVEDAENDIINRLNSGLIKDYYKFKIK